MQQSNEQPQSTQTIDWQALREELGWEDINRDTHAEDTLLQHRARQYASLLPDPDEATDMQTVLVFQLGKEHYGIDVTRVKGVRQSEKITPVPGVPRFYRGVVNIRGQILTVLDLLAFLEIANEHDTAPEELIIVQVHALELGLLAHHIQDVVTVTAQEIDPLEEMRYALGMTKDRVIILDIMRLFEDERLIVGGVDE